MTPKRASRIELDAMLTAGDGENADGPVVGAAKVIGHRGRPWSRRKDRSLQKEAPQTLQA